MLSNEPHESVDENKDYSSQYLLWDALLLA